MPKISVILPAYNAEKFIAEAVQSILDQTFTDFELIVVEDASTDNTLNVLKAFNDPRIRLIANPVNQHVVKSLNKGLDIAKGDFIARMDADDISYPERFAKQLAYFDAHPETAVCGTWARVFGAEDILLWPYHKPEDIQANLLFFNTIVHPTVMIRRQVFEKPRLRYDEQFVNAEDYGLWAELMGKHEIAILPEVLLKYRFHESNASVLKDVNRTVILKMNQMAYRTILSRAGISFTSRELDLHWKLAFKEIRNLTAFEVKEYTAWLAHIVRENRHSKFFSGPALRNVIIHALIFLIKRTNRGPSAFIEIIKAFLTFYSPAEYVQFNKIRGVRKRQFNEERTENT